MRVSDVFVLPNGKAFSVQAMSFNGGTEWVTFVEVESSDHLRLVGSSDLHKIERSEFEHLFAQAEKVVL